MVRLLLAHCSCRRVRLSDDIFSDVQSDARIYSSFPEHECGLFWQEDVQVAEESSGRPRRTGRSAQAANAAKTSAKSTMVKLGAPKPVGLPKPPQVPAKVRGISSVLSI